MGNELLSVLREHFAALSSSAHLRESACSLTSEIRAQRDDSQSLTELLAKHSAVCRVLDFLAADTYHSPPRLQAVDPCLLDRIHSLVGHVDIDLNAPLSPDDE
ncbi:type II toxin-antitoxin system PrlF family antitoxin [Pseudomonas sp. MF6776]|uniref:type II toxin-antitoxin system PrlF family antitoxin n=1 Tax=Pseudomonas sp. MF6776 TaxID=2797534 RepID=UPI00190CAED2|nr:type II toxin-antitoxin system PrlF family antitoxin [Pseudomonas sp. MF6776]MBK3468169.1 hypothetical protein [Pseudomonas sp. MF6776]